MKFGISSYALTWSIGVPGYTPPINPLSLTDLLDLARENNMPLVQIADNIPLEKLSQVELKAIQRYADSLNIRLEIGTRGTDPELLLRYLHIAKMMGSNIVRTLITEADIGLAVDDIKSLLPEYAKSDVILAIENHGLHTTKQLANLFDELHHPNVGCCLDTVNSFGALESPEQVIHTLAPYTVKSPFEGFRYSACGSSDGVSSIGNPSRLW